MSSDSGYVGDGAYIAFGGTALNTNYRKLTPNNKIGLVDQSAGADVGMSRLTTLSDSDFTLEIKRPVGGTANWVGLVPGSSGTFEFGPEGTATGKPRQYVVVILESHSVPVIYNDLTVETFKFQQSDQNGVTNTLY